MRIKCFIFIVYFVTNCIPINCTRNNEEAAFNMLLLEALKMTEVSQYPHLLSPFAFKVF